MRGSPHDQARESAEQTYADRQVKINSSSIATPEAASNSRRRLKSISASTSFPTLTTRTVHARASFGGRSKSSLFRRSSAQPAAAKPRAVPPHPMRSSGRLPSITEAR
jgi:hypothetical protein